MIAEMTMINPSHHGRWLFEIIYLCFVSELWDILDHKEGLWKSLVANRFKHFPYELRTTYVLHTLEQAIFIESSPKSRWDYWMHFLQDIGWLGILDYRTNSNTISSTPIYISRFLHEPITESLLQTTSALSYTIYQTELIERNDLSKMVRELEYVYAHRQHQPQRQWMDISEIMRFYLKHTSPTERLYQSFFMRGLASIYAIFSIKHPNEDTPIKTEVVAYGLYGMFLGIPVVFQDVSYKSREIALVKKEIQIQKPEWFDTTCVSIRFNINEWESDPLLATQKGKVPISIKQWYRQLFRFVCMALTIMYPDVDNSEQMKHPWMRRMMELSASMDICPSSNVVEHTAYLYHLTRILYQPLLTLGSQEPFLEMGELWRTFVQWTTVHIHDVQFSPRPFHRRFLQWKKCTPSIASEWVNHWFGSKIPPKGFGTEEDHKQLALASWLMMDGLQPC